MARRKMKGRRPAPEANQVEPKVEEPTPEEVERGEPRDEFDTRGTVDRRLLSKLRAHHSKRPNLSGGDLDAAWDFADAGDETVGGTVATPDQDIVEELGEAAGLTYHDDEPLNIEDKLVKRDRKRWELNPASAQTNLDEGNEDWDPVDDEEEFLEEYGQEVEDEGE
ncbi:MAG: DUF6335 family protein [Anaerolineales bacterium]